VVYNDRQLYSTHVIVLKLSYSVNGLVFINIYNGITDLSSRIYMNGEYAIQSKQA